MNNILLTLMRSTGLSEQTIVSIIRNAPVRYKTYFIPKRNGGLRLISHPARELKLLQRALIAELLNDLPVHPCATAYRSGWSIRHNAIAHAKNGPILKFDFKNFFPSITASDWQKYCLEFGVFDHPSDISYSMRILFQKPSGGSVLRLAIGAPSSPILSNILMCRFDNLISTRVAEDHVTYTRYADDLTFSARRTGYLTGVEKILRKAIREISYPSLQINDAKTVLATMRYKRMVTGLILTNAGDVSIGRERKREIRAALHHAQQGKLNLAEMRKLGGYLAFAKGIEPEFYNAMALKYGQNILSMLQSTKTSSP